MDLGLNGKVAIVTGGSDGIGKAAAVAMAAEGAKVALAARTPAPLDSAVRAIEAGGGVAMGVPTDVRDESQVQALVESVVDAFGRLDILVNNAGTSAAHRFESITDAIFAEDFAVKVYGAMYCIRAAGQAMTKSLSRELAPDGIRVNTVCIGLIKSGQHRRRWEALQREDAAYSLDDHWASMAPTVPLGRVGEAREAGEVIAFLCSDRAAYVTGAAVNIDGGQSPVL